MDFELDIKTPVNFSEITIGGRKLDNISRIVLDLSGDEPATALMKVRQTSRGK